MSTEPFRHLVIQNFLGKVRAELFLAKPLDQSTNISFSFGLPKSGWSQFEINFVDIGYFICMISDIPNDFYGELATAVVENQTSFLVAAHMEPDTFAFYVFDSTLYLCSFIDYESYESAKNNHEKMLEQSFMAISYSRDYLLHCLKNLSTEWSSEFSKDWAHQFPHDILVSA